MSVKEMGRAENPLLFLDATSRCSGSEERQRRGAAIDRQTAGGILPAFRRLLE